MVQNIDMKVVKNFARDEFANRIVRDDYFVCLNKECKVAYFGYNKKVMLKNSDLKMQIWFKDGTNPKYICYCSKVTEAEITEAVVKHGARTVNDIVKITGAMKNSNCKINNPLGKCCSSDIQKVINNIIENEDFKG